MTYNPNSIKAGWATTMADLGETFEKWGVTQWEVRPMREVDKKYHWPGTDNPPEVTVSYVHHGDTVKLAMSKHPYYFQNFRILFFALETMRMNEARGLDEVLRDAYLQLSAPARERDPWEVLGLRSDADQDAIEAVYRAKAKRLHPDVGGSAEAFQELQKAYEAVKA